MRHIIVCLFLLACSLSVHAEDKLPSELPPEQEARALRAAEETGALLLRHDRAAWVATDAVMNSPGFKDNSNRRGWVTQEHDGRIDVTFLESPESGTMHALYRVSVDPQGKAADPVRSMKDDEALSAYEAAAASALRLALASKPSLCRAQYNPVVLPAGEGLERWAVYLIPGTTSKHIVPVGGAHRIEVDTKTGETVDKSFSYTCLELNTAPKSGQNLAGLMLTHLRDPVPTEIHVFWSLWAKLPMYVSTPPHGTLWSIERGKIELMQRKSAP